ncbi:MAG: FAD-dependent oxidoreductase [Deltaproteobacteria bacterium]|nr:FAD-dependent oxidoreductase [Deltaproteobacteria bacterium]MBW2137275.1 FAD-dependent oxidoreductase [Deltaproteobacteria bacterium]
MEIRELADEIIETDVLVIGGGLAGCMAALQAKEHGVRVSVLEKAAIRRSGECGRGIDHYPIPHPYFTGIRAEEYGQMRASEFAGMVSKSLSIITAEESLKPLIVLEDIGVKIREEDGSVKIQPGRISLSSKSKDIGKGDFLLYRGADVKIKLAAALKERGVDIFDRTMLTALLVKDGSVKGATAVNVRNAKFIVFKAKTFVLSTGGIQRLYAYPSAPFPNHLFIGYTTPTNAGGGTAAAYRAGARLSNLEFVYIHTTTAGLPWGQLVNMGATVVNSKGEDLWEKYPHAREKYPLGGLYPTTNVAFMPNTSEAVIGRDVIYFDTSQITREKEWGGNIIYGNECPTFLGLMLARGGIKKEPVELKPWLTGLPRNLCGVLHDERGESSLKGLFVAGDVGGGLALYGATAAFAWGYRVGHFAAEDALQTQEYAFDKTLAKQVYDERQRVIGPLGLENGLNPLELEEVVRNLMRQNVGINKIEPRLKRTLEQLHVIKEEFIPCLSASNAHELMRVIEVKDIIDIAEIHTNASLIRTESRMAPAHFRIDYPEQDDSNWRKSIIIERAGGKMNYSLEEND